MNARRAFALPMVLMLVLVSSIMLGVMIERHVAQAMTVQRQIDTYGFGHVTRGIGEALDGWVKSNGQNAIADALDGDNLAFSLETAGGETVRIHLQDGQGLALADLAGFGGDTLATGRGILRSLRESEGENASRFVRGDGPLAVSVNSAPPQVLRAVLDSVLETESNGVVSEILSRRGGTGMTADELTQLLGEAPEITPDVRPRVSALLTANPVLWRVTAYSARRATGIRGNTYQAWVLITRTAPVAAGDRASALQRNVSIFDWELVEER